MRTQSLKSPVLILLTPQLIIFTILKGCHHQCKKREKYFSQTIKRMKNIHKMSQISVNLQAYCSIVSKCGTFYVNLCKNLILHTMQSRIGFLEQEIQNDKANNSMEMISQFHRLFFRIRYILVQITMALKDILMMSLTVMKIRVDVSTVTI